MPSGGDWEQYRGAKDRHPKKARPCSRCGRPFVPRYGRGKYCYDPACQMAREKEAHQKLHERKKLKKQEAEAMGRSWLKVIKTSRRRFILRRPVGVRIAQRCGLDRYSCHECRIYATATSQEEAYRLFAEAFEKAWLEGKFADVVERVEVLKRAPKDGAAKEKR